MCINYTIKKSRKINDITIITPNFFSDNRGIIYSTFDDELTKRLIPGRLKFNHVKVTTRKKGVLAGIHGDHKSYKLVTCIKGKITQYSVCNYKKSKNYLKFTKNTLSEKNKKMVLIPPGYGNAFICLENSIIIYHYAYFGKYNDVDTQFTLKWNDKRVGIKWPIKNPILSKRDK